MEKNENVKKARAEALEAARAQIDKQFGKGSIMRLGDAKDTLEVEAIPSGSLLLDEALGVGGYPKGRIIEIINDAGSMIRMRKEAAHKVFDQYPDIEIAYSLVYSWPDYDADIMDQVSAILTKEGDNISGVFASFDGVGVSAYKAIKEFGLQDKIFICGVDGDPDVYALMKADGENCNFICTMAQDPDTMARTCVRAVVDLLNGKTLDSKVEYIPGIKVTPANVNEIG